MRRHVSAASTLQSRDQIGPLSASEASQTALREQLAALEHEQWMAWSQSIATSEPISPERLHRWAALWVPYDELTEEQKDQDRVWADKVLALLTASA